MFNAAFPHSASLVVIFLNVRQAGFSVFDH
jgi:hypothetical protein